MELHPPLVADINRRQCGTVHDRRQTAGVAVSEKIDPAIFALVLLQQLGAMLADGSANAIVFFEHREGFIKDLLFHDRDDPFWSCSVFGLESGRVTLRNVHFATGKADIGPGSDVALAAAAQAMKDHPDWKIRVEGFTDNTGNADANQKLSQERADAVMGWLVNHGVDQSRLEAKGYGQDRPVASNDTDADRRRNRRVELVRQ